MRLIGRNDASLIVGLIAGTVVVFQQPLRFVWDAARDVQIRYHVDLVPALVIFGGVFLFHEYRKQREGKADAAVAAAEAAQSRARSEELERLMTFSLGLSNALDTRVLQQVLWRHLPGFSGERECWLLARTDNRWEALLQETAWPRAASQEDLEESATKALAPATLDAARVSGILDGGTLCFPMMAGGAPVAVLGVRDGETLTAGQRRALGTGAALIALAIRNIQLFLETREQGLRDNLTGCFNRGHGLEVLDLELRRARRQRGPLAIVMFDIDHFKTINDRLGHLRGDDLLRATGAQLTRVLRSTDVRCRYGGDEFLIILPDTPLLGAMQVAEALRREFATLAMNDDGGTVPVSLSIGVAVATASDLGVTTLIERADQALYQAKREGRDRSCAAAAPESASRLRTEPEPDDLRLSS